VNDASRSVSQSLGRGGGDGLVIFLANRIPEVPGPSSLLSVLWGPLFGNLVFVSVFVFLVGCAPRELPSAQRSEPEPVILTRSGCLKSYSALMPRYHIRKRFPILLF